MSQHKQQQQCRAAEQSAVARVIGWLRETVAPRPPGHWTLSRDGRLIRERSLDTTEQ
ncbi:MAG TPA: hypothetical protein VFS21_25960 [Roseiflexaceae bacterium]|nr:hypothetical protein [Roseiflexaceae bacterium]